MSRRSGHLLVALGATLVLGSAVYGDGTQATKKPAPQRTDAHGDPLPDGAVGRLGTARLVHGRSIVSVAFRPDGKAVVSAGVWGPLRMWDTATGKELGIFEGHDDSLRAVEFSPDGKTLVAAGARAGALHFWDVDTRHYIRRVGPEFPTNSSVITGASIEAGRLVFSSDGKILVHAHWGVKVHDATNGTLLHEIAPEEHKRDWHVCAALSPDGKLLATGDDKHDVRLWEPTGKHLLKLTGHNAEVVAVVFSPDGKTLASADTVGQFNLWDPASGKRLIGWRGKEPCVRSIVFTADSKGLISASSDSDDLLSAKSHRICLWDTATGAEVRQFGVRPSEVASLAISRDGKLLASGGNDALVRLWDVRSGNPSPSFDGHRVAAESLAFHPDGTTLFSGGWEGIFVWDVKACKLVRRIGDESTSTRSMSLSANGGTLASAHCANVQIWDTGTGKQLHRFLGSDDDYVLDVALAPDSSLVALQRWSGLVQLGDPATGKMVHQFRPGRPSPGSLGFCVLSPDGRLAAVQGTDGSVQLWRTDQERLVHTLTLERTHHSRCVAFSPDGRTLATGGDIVVLWDVVSGEELHRLPGEVWAASVVFSPDGRTLFTAGHKDAIRLWEVATGRERRRFSGHRDDGLSWCVHVLAVSPDGDLLASGGQDTTILLWDLTGRLTGGDQEHAALTPADLTVTWEELASTDSVRADLSARRLILSPRQAVSFLREKLPPAPRPEPGQVARLIRDLDSDNFKMRDQATEELKELGETAAPALQKALQGTTSQEFRRRAEQLLERLGANVDGSRLRHIRTVETLEHIGGTDARHLLEALAGGAPEARLTQEAKASLTRLTKRPEAPR